MTRDNRTSEDALLDALFDAGKSHAPQPSEAFLARLSVEAEVAVPRPEVTRAEPPQASLFARFKGLFAASGLSSAAALGLWVGFVAPDLLTTYSPLSEDVAALSAFLPGADLSVLSE